MRDFNEWSQCVVLELLARYKPVSQEETFNIMNLLEERLRHSNSAVVLGATKVFLNLTEDMPAVHQQVFSRLKAPMLTLMTAGVFEQACAFSHGHFTDSWRGVHRPRTHCLCPHDVSIAAGIHLPQAHSIAHTASSRCLRQRIQAVSASPMTKILATVRNDVLI